MADTSELPRLHAIIQLVPAIGDHVPVASAIPCSQRAAAPVPDRQGIGMPRRPPAGGN